jgi:hypothetical protein
MKRYMALMLMAIMLVTLFSSSAFALTKAELTATKVSKAPTIDGKLDDEAWTKAKVVTLDQDNNGAKPGTKVEAWVVWDDENIYVACKNYRAKRMLVANAKSDGGDAWRDDSNEIFVDPAVDGKGIYYQFISNSLGYRLHTVKPMGAIQYTDWKAAAVQENDYWTLEVQIPFATMKQKTPKVGTKWGFNICANSGGQNITWSPLRGGFHQPNQFGAIIFGE